MGIGPNPRGCPCSQSRGSPHAISVLPEPGISPRHQCAARARDLRVLPKPGTGGRRSLRVQGPLVDEVLSAGGTAITAGNYGSHEGPRREAAVACLATP